MKDTHANLLNGKKCVLRGKNVFWSPFEGLSANTGVTERFVLTSMQNLL